MTDLLNANMKFLAEARKHRWRIFPSDHPFVVICFWCKRAIPDDEPIFINQRNQPHCTSCVENFLDKAKRIGA